MFFSKFATAVAALVAVPAVLAQTTHNVVVGATGLTFSPNQVTAAVGDIVTFEFHPKNHTLTQSTFASPCAAMAGGVDSGFMPVAATATTFPVFSFKINEVTPLWFYCAQANHCTSGMVMAINVNTTSPNTFDAFLAKATGGASSAAVTASGSSIPTTATGAAGASVTSVAAAATSGTTANGATGATGAAAGNGAGRLATASVASFALTAVGVIAGLAL
ncbi:hypothetical protein FRC04_011664 [Tulasnella sp. 424]|nr:hypothetical protein FRC04_011664 [Tulasnella sp. 424]KAG8971482.1 hypothetical protein FRC05_011055 [Tulasnella sp. 425]